VELTMRPAQYDAFRRAQRAIVLAHLPIDQLDRARRHWHDSVPGAHPHD
jgi:phenol hydroxylase P0 protein